VDILQTFQSSNFPEFCEKIVNLLVTKFTNFMNSSTYQLLAVLITPVVVIYGSEIFVDYLKHTFITKFNQIKPNVYTKYRDSLCKDFAAPDHNKKKYSDVMNRGFFYIKDKKRNIYINKEKKIMILINNV